MATKSPLYTLFEESVQSTGLFTIRAASAQRRFRDYNTKLLSRSQKPFYCTTITTVWLASTISLMTAIVNTSIVVFAVATRRSTKAGLLAVGLTQAISLQDIISLMLTSWTQMEISAVALERNLEYTQLSPEEEQKQNLRPSVNEHWPENGELKFESVHARYSLDGECILRGISFHCSPRSKIGERDIVLNTPLSLTPSSNS